MSQIHQCNDGTTDITGRNTPKGYVVCANRGGEKSIKWKSLAEMLGTPYTKPNCGSTNPTWKAKVKVWSSPLSCPTGYEDVAPNGKCCKPIVKVSDTATEKPKTFLEKNRNLLIVGGIILGALLLIRK
jgi:hypothetical protein